MAVVVDVCIVMRHEGKGTGQIDRQCMVLAIAAMWHKNSKLFLLLWGSAIQRYKNCVYLCRWIVKLELDRRLQQSLKITSTCLCAWYVEVCLMITITSQSFCHAITHSAKNVYASTCVRWVTTLNVHLVAKWRLSRPLEWLHCKPTSMPNIFRTWSVAVVRVNIMYCVSHIFRSVISIDLYFFT